MNADKLSVKMHAVEMPWLVINHYELRSHVFELSDDVGCNFRPVVSLHNGWCTKEDKRPAALFDDKVLRITNFVGWHC